MKVSLFDRNAVSIPAAFTADVVNCTAFFDSLLMIDVSQARSPFLSSPPQFGDRDMPSLSPFALPSDSNQIPSRWYYPLKGHDWPSVNTGLPRH